MVTLLLGSSSHRGHRRLSGSRQCRRLSPQEQRPIGHVWVEIGDEIAGFWVGDRLKRT